MFGVWEIGCLVVGLVDVIGFIMVAIWFLSRMSIQPIKGRWPILSVLGVGFLNLYLVAQIFVRLDFDDTTAAVSEIPSFFIAPAAAFLLARFIVFFISSKLVDAADELTSPAGASRKSWFLQRKHWFTRRNYALGALILTFVFWIPNIVIYFIRFSWLSSVMQNDPGYIAWQFGLEGVVRNMAIFLIAGVTLIILAPKLAKIHENLGLKKDAFVIIINSIYLSCYFTMYFVITSQAPISPSFANFLHAIFLWSGCAWIPTSIMLINPLVRSYAVTSISKQSTASDNNNSKVQDKNAMSGDDLKNQLLRVLQDPEGLKLIHKFCKEDSH
jgi:hypothetical protein